MGDLEPGPKLDKLIAEKVMGYAKDDNDPDISKTLRIGAHDPYSIYIEAAMTAVNHILDKDQNTLFDLNCMFDATKGKRRWTACLSYPNDESKGAHVRTSLESPAHAICLCLLKVVGRE